MLRMPLSRSAARLRKHAKWPPGARNFNATTRRKAEVQLTIDGKQVSIEGSGSQLADVLVMEALT